ncbi:MAG: hypothetical protein V1755_02075 [Chloroflexota bacterium]
MRPRFLYALSTLLVSMLACGLPSAAETTAMPLPPTPAFDTQVPAPPAAAQPAPSFRDDFDGALAAGWQWLGADPTHWNLTSTPGHLRIVIQPSNINDGQVRNFLVREAPQGNFEIGTSVRFTPASNFQLAGLLVYQDQGNAMQFGPAYAPCAGGSAGQCVYFDSFQGGTFGAGNYATYTGGGSPAYLRLRRAGTTYTASFSADGSNWKEIGSHQSSITPRYVGLVGVQGYNGEAPADFDYFTLEQFP